MSVYGDMLNFFPELFETFNTFTMAPKVKAGYEQRENERDIRGVLQFVKPGQIGIEVDTLADFEYPTLWTREVLGKDAYIETSDSAMLYRRIKNNSWVRCGAFNVYVFEVVVGVDGRQEPEEAVDYGRSKYL